MLKALRQQVASRARKLKDERQGRPVEKDDVLEGLTAVVTVRLAEPQFEGQTKEVLGTPGRARIVARVVDKELDRRFTRPSAATRNSRRCFSTRSSRR